VRTAQRAETLISAPERALFRRGKLDSNHLTLPHFIGLGAPKSGSTWIHHNLDRHPDVFVPPEKELHYFCHFHHRSIRWYAGKFAATGNRVRGEITPNYCELGPAPIDEIADLMPGLKLLLMMRNPIERAWSHAQMNLARQQGRPVESVPTGEFVAHFRSAHNIESGDYPAIIDRWSRRYPAERLWLGTYDEMVEQPKELLTSLFAFLEVAVDVDWSDFPTETVIDRGRPGSDDLVGRRGGGSDLPDDLRRELEAIWAPRIELMAERFGARAERWVV
jgi:hypothetical protein